MRLRASEDGRWVDTTKPLPSEWSIPGWRLSEFSGEVLTRSRAESARVHYDHPSLNPIPPREEALKLPDLRQALYDEGAILRDVLVNLHGEAHKARRRVEGQPFGEPIFGDWRWVLPALMARALAERRG